MSDKRTPDILDDVLSSESPQGEKIEKRNKRSGKRPPSKDPIKTKGLSLKSSEWDLLENIGDELGTNRHAIAVWAIRDFLKRYAAGEIETVEKRTLPGM